MRLKSLPGYVVKRREAKIIRFRNYGEQSDPNNYYREQLMLYVPWRSEEALLSEGVKQLYRKYQVLIEQEEANYVSGFSSEQFLQNATQELNEINDENDGQQYPDIQFLYEEGMQTDFLRDIGIDKTSLKIEHLLSPKLIDNEKYNAMLRPLNELQIKFLLYVLHLIKTHQNATHTSFLPWFKSCFVTFSSFLNKIWIQHLYYSVHQLEKRRSMYLE
jgi:hypothetical protein